jgi:hypothetical protein
LRHNNGDTPLMLPDIAMMTPLNSDQLLAEFDAILDRVEAGECFVIDGLLVLIPYNEETIALLAQTAASGSPSP